MADLSLETLSRLAVFLNGTLKFIWELIQKSPMDCVMQEVTANDHNGSFLDFMIYESLNLVQ